MFKSHIKNPSKTQLQKTEEKLHIVQIDQINDAIQYAQKYIKLDYKSEHSVIFWGNTGTGKSTTITILNGQTIYGYGQFGTPVLTNFRTEEERANSKKNNKGKQATVFIQNQAISGTVYPAYLPMKGADFKQSITLWDTPGFGDTKGITQILINTYFIHRLFNVLPSVKLFFTLNFNYLRLDLKGKQFKKIALTLADALSKFKDYQHCMGLLVTKVPLQTTLDDVMNLFQKNMEQHANLESQKQIKVFFDNIKRNKMMILMIFSPDVSNQFKANNPKDVTSQYDLFKKNFYDIVTSNLRPAQVPKLQAPGMSPQEIEKCESFSAQTNKKIDVNIQAIIDKLKTYIVGILNKVRLQKNKNNINKAVMDNIKLMKNFVQSLQKHAEKNCTGLNELNVNFKSLKDLFQSDTYQFSCENIENVRTCVPMQNLRNLQIVVDFLTTINFKNQSTQLTCQGVLRRLFNALMVDIPNIQQIMNNQINKITQQFQKMIESSMKDHFDHWMQQQLVQNWKKQMVVLPELYRNVYALKKNVGIKNYLTQLKQLQQRYNIKCTQNIDDTIQLQQYNLNHGKLKLDQSKIMNQEINKICINQIEILKLQTNLDNWTQMFCRFQGVTYYPSLFRNIT